MTEAASSSSGGGTLAAGGPLDTGAETPPTDPRRRFFAAGALGLLWLAALALTTLTTANPTMLNRIQIRQAQYVVTGTVLDRAAGRVRIARVWKGRILERPDEVTIENLADTGVRNGIDYVIPLSKRTDGRLVVTETRLPNGRPLVYPATPDALAELEPLLTEP